MKIISLSAKSRLKITSAPKVDIDEHIKYVAELTDENNHNGALLEATKIINDASKGKAKKLLEIITAIGRICYLEGETPHELMDYRERTRKRVMTIGKQSLTPEQYEALRMSM